MSVFMDILNLLTGSPGGLVYYLVLLLSVWAIVGLALSRWSRGEHHDIVPRILVAGSVLSFSRFVPIVVALLDRQTNAYLVPVGPPLERFMDALAGLLICWAYVIPPRKHALSGAFVGTTLVFSVGLYAIGAVQWMSVLSVSPGSVYNQSWQAWAWELWQLLFLLPALVYLLASPAPERGTLGISLAVLVAGHVLQAGFPFAEQIPHFAAWSRFANLLAFPLLAVTTYRLMVQRFDAQYHSLQGVNQESLAQLTGLMSMLDTVSSTSASLDLDAVLDQAVRGLSQALHSDLCALALVPEAVESGEGTPAQMELSAVYNAPQVSQERTLFDTAQYAAIHYAMSRGKAVLLDPAEESPGKSQTNNAGSQIAQIHQLLNSAQSGPLIVQPLQHKSVGIGAILVCRPGQSAPFTPLEARKCETLATHMAAAIGNARRYRQVTEQIGQLNKDLQLLKTEYTRTRAHLQNRLKQSKEELTVYIQKLYETEIAEGRAQNDARDMRRELAKLRDEAEAQVAQSRAELQHSAEETSRVSRELAKLDGERLRLEDHVRRLEQEKSELQFQLAVAATVQPDLVSDLQRTAEPSSGREPAFSLLEHIASGVMVCDPSGRVVYANSAVAHLTGHDPARLVGQSALALWDDSRWQAALHSVTDRHPTPAAAGKHVSSTGMTASPKPVLEHLGRSLQVEMAPYYAGGQHAGAVILIFEAPLVDERTRARDEFLASLAQDLRTPMTSILGYTELLMNESVGKLGGIQRKFLQRVQANVERMSGMLNDLIGVTAIDSGKLAIELEPVDIVNVVETALRKIQFRLEEKELDTRVEISEVPVILADPECVQQVVDNLLTNACKSSEAGSTISIQASVQADTANRSFLHVSVTDTGGGIAPEDQTRVFERFYRADNALIAGLGETGVGLAIVKALVEAHQGQVWHDSQTGVGTTFHFTLPYGLEQTVGGGASEAVVTEQSTPGGNGRG